MNISERPAISVITCLYNTQPNLFEQCLQSIHNQRFTDFEVLIINDGSDKYLEENKALIEKLNDARFKYFDTEHTGKSQTLNYGFKIAKGKYIAINDADDQMHPERLAYQFNFLENSDYDVISNAMMTDDNHIIFPQVSDSHEVKENEVHVAVMHPSYMLNKENVLQKVPFLFSQIYDSMEDAVFNQIMFHYGVKMWYDNNVLQIYSHNNEGSVHFENVNDKFKKDATFKLNHRTFNYNSDCAKYTTAILLVNERWGTDIEKTVLNIRMTSNNVNILVINYSSKQHFDLSYLNKYNVTIIGLPENERQYNFALIAGLNNVDTKFYMVISKPLRFYTQDWDMIYERYLDAFPYFIIQPEIIGFDKIDENNYVNENGKDKINNIRYGQQLTLLDKKISKKLNNIYLYSEYISDANIPCIDDDLVFFGITDHIKKIINGLKLFNLSTYIALYISIATTLSWHSIKLNIDVKCGCDNNECIIDENMIEFDYYTNMFKLICLFCNESKYIYEKIIWDAFANKAYAKQIINNHLENLNEFNAIKNSIELHQDISYFLKKNNSDKVWILTHQAY